MNNWRITIALAISAAGAIATDGASALYVRPSSDGKTIEQNESNGLMPLDAAFVLDALSGSIVVSSGSPRNHAMPDWRPDPDAYTIRHPSGVALKNNNGPDDYFPPKYRDGRCVEDEGNTLLAEPALGGGVRRLKGRSLERALALLCRKAAL